jgi:uncharacterized protein (DUF2147 family)
MKQLSASILVGTLLLASGAIAQTAGPVGLWKTIDDASGKPKALIRISASNGELSGKIEKLFRPANEEQNPVCAKCDGARKDQPLIGMTILEGLKPDGADYSGGKIIDPDNGKVYQSKATLADGGKQLKLRGYIGVPLLGRTQTWLREE